MYPAHRTTAFHQTPECQHEPEAIEHMAPKSRYEVMIAKVLMRIGINIVRDSYVLPRWYGEKAVEIDFVTTLRNATILIEVSANEMLDVRHLRRKDIKMWETRDVIDRVCKDLGLSRINHMRVVYMSIATEGSSWPDMDGRTYLLHWNHIEHLIEDEPQIALGQFVGWCGLSDKIRPACEMF